MEAPGQSLRSIREPQKTTDENLKFPKREPLEEGNDSKPALGRKTRIARIVLAAAFVVASAIGSACSKDEFGHGPKWDGGTHDTETSSVSDSEDNSDSDIDTGTDLDTDADTDADSDADMDSDSDGDTDTTTSSSTETTDTGSETATETSTEPDTGECPDTDSSVYEYDDLGLTAVNAQDVFWIIAADGGLGCMFGNSERVEITTLEGQFEILGINAFSNYDPPTRTGKMMFFMRANDPDYGVGGCMGVGFSPSSGVLVLRSDDGNDYGFEFANAGAYLEVKYRLNGKEMSIGIYNNEGQAYPTPTGFDEIHAVFPAGTYGWAPIVESLGIGVSWQPSASFVAASPQEEPGNAYSRIYYKSDVLNGEVLAASSSGLEICGYSDGTTLAGGSYSYSGVLIFEGSSTLMHFKVPKP